MKKIAVIAAGVLGLGCLGAFDVPALSLDTSIKFSTDGEFRGRRQRKQSISAMVEAGLSAFEKGRVYLGVESALGLRPLTTDINEVNPYVGVSYDVTDIFTLDGGYIQRFWVNRGDAPKNAGFGGSYGEVYVGIAADVLLSPSVHFAYNYKWKEVVIEGRVAYTYDLAQFGVSGVAVEFGAKVGYDKADKPYGQGADHWRERFSGDSSFLTPAQAERIGAGKAYWFYGANVDLVYSFSENARVRVGVEAAGNSGRSEAWQNYMLIHPKKMLWLNASIDCSF